MNYAALQVRVALTGSDGGSLSDALRAVTLQLQGVLQQEEALAAGGLLDGKTSLLRVLRCSGIAVCALQLRGVLQQEEALATGGKRQHFYN